VSGWAGGAAQAIIVKPDSGATAAGNPKWTSNGRIFAHSPITGAVGDLATLSFTIKPGDGTVLTRAEAD
jgi:hypothetical protein